MGMGIFEDEEERRRRRAEATASAIDGLISSGGLQLDETGFANPGYGEQSFPGDYRATSQTRDLAMDDYDAVGALAAKSSEPDPAQDRLASAASALKAEGNPDPYAASPEPAPEPTPEPEALAVPPAKVPLDLTAGGGGEAPRDEVEKQIRAAAEAGGKPAVGAEPVSDEPTEVFFREHGRYPNPDERTKIYKDLHDGAEPPAALVEDWKKNPDWQSAGTGNVPNPADPSAAPAGEGPTADPDPGKGVNSNVERSPQAKEIPELQPGKPPSPAADDAAEKLEDVPSNNEPPKAGSAQSLEQNEPNDQAANPFAALAAQGEQERQRQLESLGDRPGVNGWALLADVLFNRGKSIPQIIGQADAAGRAYDDDKRKVLTRGSDPVQQQIAMMRLQGQAGTLEQRKAEARAKADKDRLAHEEDQAGRKAFLAVHRPDLTPEQIEIFEKAPTSTWRSLESTLREKWKQSPEYQRTHALGREKDSFAGEQGTIQGRAANRDTAVANTTALSAADANARVPANIASNAGREANVTPEEAAKARREADAAAREARRLALEEERVKEAARTRKLAEENAERDKATVFKNQFRVATGGQALAAMASNLDRLQELTDKYKDKDFGLGKGVVPGKGAGGLGFLAGGAISAVVAALSPEKQAEILHDADDYQRLSQGIGVDQLYEKSGKTFGNKEIALNAFRTGISKTASADQVQAAQDELRNIVKRGLAAAGSARPDLAIEDLRDQGVNVDRWTPSAWSQPRVIPGTQVQGQPAAAAPGAPSADLAPGEKLVQGTDGSQVVTSPEIERDAAEYLAEQNGEGANPDGSPIGPPSETAEVNVDVPDEPGHKLPNLVPNDQKRRDLRKPPPPTAATPSAAPAPPPTAATPSAAPAPDAVGALAEAGKPTFKVIVIMPDGETFNEDAVTAENIQMLEREHGARIKFRK